MRVPQHFGGIDNTKIKKRNLYLKFHITSQIGKKIFEQRSKGFSIELAQRSHNGLSNCEDSGSVLLQCGINMFLS